jgi:membrane associated rhomboid family serine protease
VTTWGVVPKEYAAGTDLPPEAAGPYWITIFTSMFLHGGWMHLISNMLYLWVFGDNVEDRMGRVAFVLFYLATGAAGAIAQIMVDPSSGVPTVGASGAISGVLGAYIMMFPHKRVRVLAFYFIIEVPALIVIGLWAVTQLVSGYGSIAYRTAETGGGGVAYMAHVGGFVAGVAGALIWRLIAPRSPGGPMRGPRDPRSYAARPPRHWGA